MHTLRVVVLGLAVVVTLGSASSNQQGQPATGYYPQPSQQQTAQGPYEAPPPVEEAPPPVEEPPPASPLAQHTHQPPPAPPAQHAHQPPPSQHKHPPPPSQQQPASPPVQQPAPPAQQPAQPQQPASSEPDKPRTQWVCNATGWWQKCETQGYMCFSQMTTMLGFGATEATARFSSETECNTAMSRMMSANFAYRTSVTTRCKAISCSPPNAR